MQRPVNESMLDLDLTLDALVHDATNTSRLYAVRSRRHSSAGVNGLASHAELPGVPSVTAAKVNGTSQLKRLSEEAISETFGRFGSVDRVVLGAGCGKRARHAYISE